MKENLKYLKNVDIPSGIKFLEEGKNLTLRINQKGVNDNMQNDGSAFEAWALVAKANGYTNIKLEKEKNIVITNQKHYNRFLYRAFCFNELFDWFILENTLLEEAKEFYSKFFKSNKLIYNVPEAEPTNNPKEPEAIMERYFVKNIEKTNNLLGTNIKKFYSQLPVGTFYEKKSQESLVFTGGKSAIDFWGIENNCLHVVELKAKENSSIGVLTELFFYVCLMRDFHIRKLAKPCKITNVRGFSDLIEAKLNVINGIILTESKHPQLEQAFEELKKANKKDNNIMFDKIQTY